MKRAGGLIGFVMALTCAPEAKAQVFFVPIASNAGAISPSRGLTYGSQRHSATVSGYVRKTFYFVGPFFTTSRVTLYYYAPRQVPITPANDELAGVDLDVVKPAKTPASRPEVIPEVPEPDLPGVDVSVPRRPVRPGEAEPAKKPEAEPPARKAAASPPGPPKKEPADESTRLVQLGVTAFAHQEHGLAALRFQQAVAADPLAAKAQFLLGQALFALGKYHEAVAAIEAGMRLKPRWPQAPFRPRRDLYQGHEADLDAQLKRLESAAAEQPNNATFLFLGGYELWFDGRRAEALPLFQRARGITLDPTYLDQFLKAAPPGPVAAK